MTSLDNIKKHISNIRFSTTPLFRIENGPRIRGTCTFIEYKGFYFLLTAEHVLKDCDNDLYFLTSNNTGRLIKPVGISYSDDINDIGIILLDEQTIQEITKTYTFLEIKKGRNRVNGNNALYSFIGFPETKGRYDRYKNEIDIEHLIFTSVEADEDTRRKYGILDNKICVLYNQNQVYNVLEGIYKAGPVLYGISGCLLIQHLEDGFNFAGILTDWNQKNRRLLVGTKMNLVYSILDFAINQNSI